MRILQINATVNTSSTGRIAEEMGQVIMANGHESFIAYGRQAQSSKSNLIKIGNRFDTIRHGATSLLFDRHAFGSHGATEQLVTSIKKIEPNIIHLHNVHGYYLNISTLFQYINATQVPVVWTFHDSWPYTGHCTYYDSVGCKKWQTECYNCPKTKFYPKSLFVDQSRINFQDKKALYSNSDNMVVVTPSRWLSKEVKQSFLSKHKIKVIHNGIDLAIFKPRLDQLSKNNDKVILGVANTWDKRKGLAEFLKLSQLLPNEYKIVLIGLNTRQIKLLPENILGIKRTANQTELAKWYNKAMVFVNPTWQDNFPTTNLEALACGTPVITYNTGGSPEAVDEKTGFVVEKGDINGLLRAINKVDKLGKEHFSANCRERAERLYNKDDRYNDYINLYEEVLNNNA